MLQPHVRRADVLGIIQQQAVEEADEGFPKKALAFYLNFFERILATVPECKNRAKEEISPPMFRVPLWGGGMHTA